MGKSRRGAKRRVAVETYGSDDERAYSKEQAPDPSSSSYFNDEIDDFHHAKEKMLLERSAKPHEQQHHSSEEEVLALDDDDSASEDEIAAMEQQLRRTRAHGARERMGSDLDSQSDDGVDLRAWGNRKSAFYGDDVQHDSKKKKSKKKKTIARSDSEEMDSDALAEEAARLTQRRLAEQLTVDDFGLSLLPEMKVPVDIEAEAEVIATDVTTLTKQEKIKLVKKGSPELIPIIEDYKEKLCELRDNLLPLLACYKQGLLQPSSGVSFLLSKTQLYTDYCTNVSFYLMLKLQCQPVRDHPVIQRIVQYRTMMKRLEAVDAVVGPLVQALLERMRAGALLPVREPLDSYDLPPDCLLVSRKLKGSSKNNADESFRAKESEEEEDIAKEEEEEEGDGRRAIDYTIAKNKGLRPRRKKEFRNPRVKHRIKYRKAVSNRRGQIREVVKETKKYGGEASGIRAGVKKSVKFKV